MNSKYANEIMTNREFVALVRAKLDAGGHRDVSISRLWIDEDTQGYPFLLNVPVGAELVVPLKPMEGFFNAPAKKLDWEIGQFADALVNLRRAETMLVRYARAMRRAAVVEIAAARAEGLDILLDNVGFRPTYVGHVAGRSWKEAAYCILAAVTVRNTSFHHRPEVSEVWVEEPDDIKKELESIVTEQRVRQEQIAELEALGADLEVDAITVDLLVAHGFDVTDVLRQVWM